MGRTTFKGVVLRPEEQQSTEGVRSFPPCRLRYSLAWGEVTGRKSTRSGLFGHNRNYTLTW